MPQQYPAPPATPQVKPAREAEIVVNDKPPVTATGEASVPAVEPLPSRPLDSSPQQ